MAGLAESALVQYGAVGLLIIGLFSLSWYLLTKFVRLHREERQKLANIDAAYKNTLLDEKEQLMEVIRKNTEAHRKSTEAYQELITLVRQYLYQNR